MTSEMTGDRRRLQGGRKFAFILEATTGIRHDAVMPYTPARPFALRPSVLSLHRPTPRKELP
jgi:hypothetical protein